MCHSLCVSILELIPILKSIIKNNVKRRIKAQCKKPKHSFVEDGFIFDFTKFQTDWSNIGVVGARQKTSSEFSMNFIFYYQGSQFSLLKIWATVHQCQIAIFLYLLYYKGLQMC